MHHFWIGYNGTNDPICGKFRVISLSKVAGLRNIPFKMGFVLLWLMPHAASAGTIYRCVGSDEVPHFVETKIAGSTCKVVSQFKSPSNARALESALATPKPEPVANQSATEQASETDITPSVKVTDNVGTRVSRGAIYKKQVDGVNVYTNLGGKGAGNLHTRYVVIEKCYACSLTNTVNFGTIKLNTLAYVDEIRAASKRFGVDEAIVRAIIHAESAYRPNALSRAGAQGLMQLIPATAKRFGVNDPYNPSQNIQGGVEYLAWLLKRYSNDLTLASAAYNAGEGAVDRYKGVPPYKETRNYVVRVGQLAERYRKALKSG